jgi:DNA-binding NtrC family response regulator
MNDTQLNLLIIDDYHELQEIYDLIFETEIEGKLFGIEYCLSAEDALEKMKLIEEHHKLAVITDIVLPKMNGFDFCTILSEKYPHVIKYITTGYNGIHNVTRSKLCGVDRFFEKPFDFDELKKCLLEDHGLLN